MRDEEQRTELGGYTQPFGWWGYHWTPADRHSILWLIERGSLDHQVAAFLSLAVQARASIVVVAEPQEAGKTTLLTALLDFLPADTQPIYLRGWYERFTFLESVPPSVGYLLCNEISAHLPTYLWGNGVRRLFEAVEAGYPLATTMHATSAADALNQLAAYPISIPSHQLHLPNLVVTVGVGYATNRLLRRVTRIERISRGDEEPAVEDLARRESLRGELGYQVGRMVGTLAELHQVSDLDASAMLARRVHDIEKWLTEGRASAASIRDVVLASRR
jgi:hypothetical protein